MEWSLKAVFHILVMFEVKHFSASVRPILPPCARLEAALDGDQCEEGLLGAVPGKH